MQAHVSDRSTPWSVAAEQAVRRLAAITVAGAVLGVLVGGIGGRLAMGLLARTNPTTSGVTSDDGFTVGQFTLAGSAQLLATGLQFGLIGAVVYTAARTLMVGPRWFQIASIAAGPAVVAGALIVHRDGTDFTIFEPSWLPIALFVAIPAVYAALLTLLAERWLRADRWFLRARLVLVVPVMLLWVAVAPLIPVVILVWLLREWLSRQRVTGPALGHPATAWLFRAGLAAMFVVALIDLTADTRALV